MHNNNIEIIEKNEDITILVVDDTLANLELLITCLGENGYKTSFAKNGEMALKRAEYLIPDLILLDVQMPGMDGFEVCRKLKENDITKDIPVIFMSAFTEISNKETGFAAGGVDYLTKPVNTAELLARLKMHLSLIASEKCRKRSLAIRDENNALHIKLKRLESSLTSIWDCVSAIDFEKADLKHNTAPTEEFDLIPVLYTIVEVYVPQICSFPVSLSYNGGQINEGDYCAINSNALLLYALIANLLTDVISQITDESTIKIEISAKTSTQVIIFYGGTLSEKEMASYFDSTENEQDKRHLSSVLAEMMGCRLSVDSIDTEWIAIYIRF